ncbi:phosphate signaling complex protein PhoU [bacterium]|nr:phosphate signaling complex protein PhoU [bacterium]
MDHTDKQYEKDLQHLKELILRMGSLVEEMLRDDMKALEKRDSTYCDAVKVRESNVNQIEIDINEACLKLLALHQPAASDLRFITIGFRIASDLERMGDLAESIAKHIRYLNQDNPLDVLGDFPAMADDTLKMVKLALDAFVNRDTDAAVDVCKMDDTVDKKKWSVQEKIIDKMKSDPESIVRGTRCMQIARHLERIADHATNIAEEIIFMVKGVDIRHMGKRSPI